MSKKETKTLLGSASQLHRTIPCPSSYWLPAVAKRPEEWDKAARRGSIAHSYLQYADQEVKWDKIPSEYEALLKSIDLKRVAGMYTPPHFREVAVVHNGETGECREVLTQDGSRDYGSLAEEDTPGTADVVIKGFRTLEIWDYKFGKWPVKARRNSQLLHNALCAKRIYVPTVTQVVLGVQQISENGVVSNDVWCTDGATLDLFEKKLTEAQERAKRVKLAVLEGKEPEVWPDKEKGYGYCRFCPAKPGCPAYKGKLNV